MTVTCHKDAERAADPNHGYLVGAKGIFLETNDGGDTWAPR
jgi:photosystem II stability/assembly factor-like uncharacterized protein